jgi:hypothetical protein
VTDITPTFVDALPESTRGRTAKYDFSGTYDALLKNGKAAQITQGKHFTCSGASMRQYIYRDAKEHGLKAEIHSKEEENEPVVITFSVAKETEEDKQKAKDRAKKRAETKKAKEAAEADGNKGSQDGPKKTEAAPNVPKTGGNAQA